MGKIRFSEVKTQQVVVWYTEQHLTLAEISKLTGMSRAGIHKRLRGAGITREQGTRVDLVCDFCGSRVRKGRGQWRKTSKHYCGRACYFAALENPGYHPWRQGQRLARALVAQHFTLSPDHVVDHRDGDNRNNDLANLRVYTSHADHMRMHRGGDVVPVWDGGNIV